MLNISKILSKWIYKILLSSKLQNRFNPRDSALQTLLISLALWLLEA